MVLGGKIWLSLDTDSHKGVITLTMETSTAILSSHRPTPQNLLESLWRIRGQKRVWNHHFNPAKRLELGGRILANSFLIFVEQKPKCSWIRLIGHLSWNRSLASSARSIVALPHWAGCVRTTVIGSSSFASPAPNSSLKKFQKMLRYSILLS